MEGRKRIAVVGSDARQAAAGRALARAGYAVAGAEQVARADVILLPLPLDESRTPLAQLLRAAKPGAFALGGRLSAQAVEIARQDTRFGTGNYWKEQLEAAAGHPVLDTLQAVEPLGPHKMAQALVVAPCTGATLSRLAAGLSDTPVTLAAKSLLRVGCPVVLAVSTNDGLGASGENIARLFQRKHYYFVPYGQDDPAAKPQSLKADFARLPAALEAALHGEQLQPVLLGQRERAMAFQPGQNVVY